VRKRQKKFKLFLKKKLTETAAKNGNAEAEEMVGK
jgi:hypothetical protein